MTKGLIPFFMTLLFAFSSWGSGFEMVAVPAGQLEPFWLTPVSGKNKNLEKAKPLKIAKFEAMKYPVTVAQFREFLTSNPGWEAEQVSTLFADASYLASWSEQLENPQAPVVNVSWFAARAFCENYDMRLPFVNEWEYMAAASETKKYANTDEKFLRRILNWYGEPKGKKLRPVGSIYKNLYGIWDLHGLIWEWVEDFNTSFVTGESREDSAMNRDMFCGSGAVSSADKTNYAAFMRFAFRSSLKGRSSSWNLGFRCVR